MIHSPLRPYLPYLVLGLLAAAIGLLIGVYMAGHSAGADSVRADWDAANAKAANSKSLKEAEYRQIERAMGEAVAELWTSMKEAQEETRYEYESTISDIESGALRLRSDLAGCRSRVSAAASSAPGNNETGEAGLSEERQGVALQIFRDADEVAKNLQGAQRYITEVCTRPDST